MDSEVLERDWDRLFSNWRWMKVVPKSDAAVITVGARENSPLIVANCVGATYKQRASVILASLYTTFGVLTRDSVPHHRGRLLAAAYQAPPGLGVFASRNRGQLQGTMPTIILATTRGKGIF